jgi:predicted CXXCH cytochrome family protein
MRCRTVAYECMGCHNASPQIPAGHAAPGSEAVYSVTLPEGIDCQRCHGSGATHTRTAQTAGASVQSIRNAILNPARLGRDRRLEVCYQCHLATTSHPLPHSIGKYGREPFSYNPAEPLGNFMIFFDYAKSSGHEDDFEIAHSAYRLRQSKCFPESRTMTCTTCHDPHDIPHGEQATLHYNGVCAQCHAAKSAQHPAATDCVSCHMPKRPAQDVPHAVTTDHLIQRIPSAVARPRPGAATAVQYYPPTPDPLYTAVAQADAPGLAAGIQKQKPIRPEFYVEPRTAWLEAGNAPNAVAAFAEALRRHPNSSIALLGLGEALARSGQPARAVEVLTGAVKLHSADPLLWYQLGLQTDSIPALEKAVALDPPAGRWMDSSGHIPRLRRRSRQSRKSLPQCTQSRTRSPGRPWQSGPPARCQRRSPAGRILLRPRRSHQAERP